MPYRKIKARRHTFVFKCEPDHPDLLHIYVRHLKEPDDAIHIFFHGSHCWNEEKARFETSFEGEGISWFWLDEES